MFPQSPEVVAETLDRLDFTPTCAAPECAEPADTMLMLTPCGHVHLVCLDCARVNVALARTELVGCVECGQKVDRLWMKNLPVVTS